MAPVIRPYEPKDFDATAHICRATLPPSIKANPTLIHLSPYVWTHQYTHLSPSTCLVLDNGSGLAVGYVIGCPSIPAFAARYEKYVTEVLGGEKGIERPTEDGLKDEPWFLPPTADGGEVGGEKVNPEALRQQAFYVKKLLYLVPELVEGWSGTMHIDLLEDYQGKGWGGKMIEEFVARVRRAEGGERNKGGIHIGIAKENEGVVKFYEKVGFRRFGEEGSLWMVRDLSAGS